MWSEITRTYEDKCSGMLEAWRHKKEEEEYELEQAVKQLQQQQESRLFSKDIATLRMTEQRLASQEKYAEAKKVHKSMRKAQKELYSKGREDLVGKVRSMQQQL